MGAHRAPLEGYEISSGAINKLPEKVALSDKAAVIAARALYDKIATYEQRALVTNYQKLTDAEKRIKDLEYLENQNNGDDSGDEAEPEEFPVWAIILIVVGGCLVLGGGAFVGVYFIIKRKNSGKDLPKALAWVASLFAKKEASAEAEAIEPATEESVEYEISADESVESTEDETAEPVESREDEAEETVEAEEDETAETAESTEDEAAEPVESAEDEAEETVTETDDVSDENSEDKEN